MNKKYLPLLAISILFIFFLSSFSFTYNPSKRKAHSDLTSLSGIALAQVESFSSDTSLPFFKAKDHKGKSVVSTSGIITFTSGLDNDYYQLDPANKTAYLYVELRLARLLNAPTNRIPLNISIVIDRSGSMQGVKMGNAKKAAKTIIDQLQSSDYASIVMYDNAIDSVQEPLAMAVANKDVVKSKIDKITPRGSTNLWGGTERGYQYVLKNYKPGFVNRVLLISDGLANIGLTDSTQIRKNVQAFRDENGITISTFGVGLDYNERLMTDMAETGAGNYYFIDRPGELVQLFDKELNGLLNVVAQNAVLKIKMPAGVKIEKTYPLKYTQVNDILMVRLLDLFSEETKGNLFKFNIQDKINKPLKFTSSLTYTDVLDGKEKTVTNENIIEPVKTVDTYLTHFNKPVLEQTILFTANENLERAMLEADKGNYVEANKFLNANTDYLKYNSIYVAGSSELRRMDSTNKNYGAALSHAQSLTADSVKKVQKAGREASYKLRNKKS